MAVENKGGIRIHFRNFYHNNNLVNYFINKLNNQVIDLSLKK